MTPLMRLGSERYIVQDDLNNLLPEDSSGYLGERLQHYWEMEMERKAGWVVFSLRYSSSVLNKSPYCSPSLWRALAYSYGGPFALALILKIFTDLLSFAQPQFLHMLLSFILEYQRGKENTSGIRGFAISLLMFVAAIAQSAILHQVSFQSD
jgi:ATP-binding cassette, subfamily C (CFTR/MRP), member 1